MTGLHSLFIQNNQLKEDIKEMCSDMSKERIITDPRVEIEKSVEKETRVQLLNSIHQLNSNSSKIMSLIQKNNELRKEIQKSEEINEATTIISTKIHANNTEIKSLISQNKDLIKEINENT
ncbi:MAG TPA: hypothetical protein VK426_02320 [Methanobacterium sp.]|nr:hypothetical protein [Methanobacterium sp.]